MPRFPVFSPAETESFRAAIDKYRAPGSYEPGKWSVEPAQPQARDRRRFSGQVVLRDIALRTTDQMPGVVLAPADRLRFMRAIAETGVPSLLIGVFGRRSADDVRAEVKLIKSINPRCEIAYGGLRHRGDLEFAAEVGLDIVQFWAAPYVEAAPMYAGLGVYDKGVARPGLARHRCRDHLPRRRSARRSSSSNGVTSRVSRCRRESTSSRSRRKATSSRSAVRCTRCARPEIVLYDGGSGMSPES
jgi:hypothetical protein